MNRAQTTNKLYDSICSTDSLIKRKAPDGDSKNLPRVDSNSLDLEQKELYAHYKEARKNLWKIKNDLNNIHIKRNGKQ